MAISIQMSRNAGQPWGFRLQGGVDFGAPLTISKVTAGTPACNAGLVAGDAVVRISEADALHLRHADAQAAIQAGGNSFTFTVTRGAIRGKSPAPPQKTPPPPKEHPAQYPGKPLGSIYNATAKPFNPRRSSEVSTNCFGKLFRSISNSSISSSDSGHSDSRRSYEKAESIGSLISEGDDDDSVHGHSNNNVKGTIDNNNAVKSIVELRIDEVNNNYLPVQLPELTQSISIHEHDYKARGESPELKEVKGFLSNAINQKIIEPLRPNARKYSAPLSNGNNLKVSPSYRRYSTQTSNITSDKERRYSNPDKEGKVPAIVNAQFNSPVNIYSEESIAETLSSQTEVLATGVLGVDFKKKEKKFTLENSEVLRMVQESDKIRGGYRTPSPGPKCDMSFVDKEFSVPTPDKQYLGSVAIIAPAAAPVRAAPAPSPLASAPAPARIAAPAPAPVAQTCSPQHAPPQHEHVNHQPDQEEPSTDKCVQGKTFRYLEMMLESGELVGGPPEDLDNSFGEGVQEIPQSAAPQSHMTAPRPAAAAPQHKAPSPAQQRPAPAAAPAPQPAPATIHPTAPTATHKDPATQQPYVAPAFSASQMGHPVHKQAEGTKFSWPPQKAENDEVAAPTYGYHPTESSSAVVGSESSSISSSLQKTSSHSESSSTTKQVSFSQTVQQSSVQQSSQQSFSSSNISDLVENKPTIPSYLPHSDPKPVSFAPPSQPKPTNFPTSITGKPVPTQPAPAPAAAPSFAPPQKKLNFPSAPAPAPAPVAPAPAPADPAVGGKGGSSRVCPKKGRGVLSKASLSGNLPVCAATGQTIRGPFITALGRYWAPDAFVCSRAECRRHLQDIGFIEEEGRLHCDTCWEKHMAPACSKCQKRIPGDCLIAIGRKWHPECFACAYCSVVFGNDPFYIEDGLPYCTDDWNQLFTTKCHGCNFPIEAGDRWVEALNNNYHSQCFKCAICKKSLEGKNFYVRKGAAVCKEHIVRGAH